MAKLQMVFCLAGVAVEHDGVRYGPGAAAGARFACMPEQAHALEAVGAVKLVEGDGAADAAAADAGTGPAVDASKDAELAELANRNAALQAELDALRAQAADAGSAQAPVDAVAPAPAAPAAKKR